MYNAQVYPIYVVIDRDGNIAGEQRGAAGDRGIRRMLRRAGLESDSRLPASVLGDGTSRRARVRLPTRRFQASYGAKRGSAAFGLQRKPPANCIGRRKPRLRMKRFWEGRQRGVRRKPEARSRKPVTRTLARQSGLSLPL
jgi:hypothetical protein